MTLSNINFKPKLKPQTSNTNVSFKYYGQTLIENFDAECLLDKLSFNFKPQL